jgi:hypothetical protein
MRLNARLICLLQDGTAIEPGEDHLFIGTGPKKIREDRGEVQIKKSLKERHKTLLRE